MKILIVHNRFIVSGGEETYITGLVNLLREHRHTVIQYIKNSSSIHSGMPSRLRQGLKVFQGTDTQNELKTIIRKHKPDVVHLGNLYPLITPAVVALCSSFGIPIVYSVLDHRLICPAGSLFRNGTSCTLCVGKKLPYYALLYSCYHNSLPATSLLVATELKYRAAYYYRSIDHLLFSSRFSQNLTLPNFPYPKEKTTIIPYFTKVLKPHAGFSPYPFPYFVYIGRLSPEKGVLKLLHVFADLPSVHLVVIGTGPLEKQVSAFQVYGNIHIAGQTTNQKKATILRNAKATVIPSSPLYEVGPFTLIESYAQSVPVIAPKSGVFLERIAEGVSGICYKPDDFEDLKKKILFVNALSKSSLCTLKQGAQKMYETNHRPERFYSALLSVYKDVLKTKSYGSNYEKH